MNLFKKISFLFKTQWERLADDIVTRCSDDRIVKQKSNAKVKIHPLRLLYYFYSLLTSIRFMVSAYCLANTDYDSYFEYDILISIAHKLNIFFSSYGNFNYNLYIFCCDLRLSSQCLSLQLYLEGVP